MSNKHNLRDKEAAETRAALIREARKRFARDGYAKTSLAEIVDAAVVTTGAVYHHFKDKKGLFLAVAEAEEKAILDYVTAAAAIHSEAWDQLFAAIDAMLEYCAKPHVQRIVFIDAPNVIGPAAWREIELKFAFGAMRNVLASLQAQKEIQAGPVDVLASILLGAMTEGAAAVASARDKKTAIKTARKTLRAMVMSIRT